MSDHMQQWAAMSRPPASALKEIRGGRLQGMTDVNPQWRYEAMTQQYGPCGTGWKYAIEKLWTEAGADGEVLAFAHVSVYVRVGPGVWSDPIVGIGGNHLIVKEARGLRNNDEAWKMAVTDALSVALKMLGVAAAIYAGRWDGSKYRDEEPAQAAKPEAPPGFDNWVMDLEVVAKDGTVALEQAWNASTPAHRKYLVDTNKAFWETLKTRAADVSVKKVAADRAKVRA